MKEELSKHWKNKDIRIIESYWNSPPAIKRSKWFANELKKYKFSSILECGMFSGRNLKFIHDIHSNIQITGIDINPLAVKFAKEKLPYGNFYELDLHRLDEMNGVNDIVFTSGVLIHIPEEYLKSIVQKMLRQAFKYVMHIEQLGFGELEAGPKELKPKRKISDQMQWSPNLIEIYKQLGYYPVITDLPEEVRTNGAKQLLVIEL